jgi:hypothetical protein
MPPMWRGNDLQLNVATIFNGSSETPPSGGVSFYVDDLSFGHVSCPVRWFRWSRVMTVLMR